MRDASGRGARLFVGMVLTCSALGDHCGGEIEGADSGYVAQGVGVRDVAAGRGKKVSAGVESKATRCNDAGVQSGAVRILLLYTTGYPSHVRTAPCISTSGAKRNGKANNW